MIFAFVSENNRDLFRFLGDRNHLKPYIGNFSLTEFVRKDIQTIFSFDQFLFDLSSLTDTENELVTALSSFTSLEKKIIVYAENCPDNSPLLLQLADKLHIYNIIRENKDYEKIKNEVSELLKRDFTENEGKRVIMGAERVLAGEKVATSEERIILADNIKIQANTDNIGFLFNFASFLANKTNQTTMLLGYEDQLNKLRERHPFGQEDYNLIHFIDKEKGLKITSSGFGSNLAINFINAAVESNPGSRKGTLLFYNYVESDTEYIKSAFKDHKVLFLKPLSNYFVTEENSHIYKAVLEDFILNKSC